MVDADGVTDRTEASITWFCQNGNAVESMPPTVPVPASATRACRPLIWFVSAVTPRHDCGYVGGGAHFKGDRRKWTQPAVATTTIAGLSRRPDRV